MKVTGEFVAVTDLSATLRSIVNEHGLRRVLEELSSYVLRLHPVVTGQTWLTGEQRHDQQIAGRIQKTARMVP